MKESFKQKMQENKPPLTFKNTKKNICLERKREIFLTLTPTQQCSIMPVQIIRQKTVHNSQQKVSWGGFCYKLLKELTHFACLLWADKNSMQSFQFQCL